ncbi:MAG: WD40 repeat domain-containing protein, partial [Myxococcota bacterium]|nr:WD40 repeat domain-containing protein [Myxococcota bacterium]
NNAPFMTYNQGHLGITVTRLLFLILATSCATGGTDSEKSGTRALEYDTASVTYHTDGDGSGDGSGGEGANGEPYVQSLSLDVSELTMTTRADEARTHRFKLLANWSDGRISPVEEGIEWRVNDIRVGTIDGDGRFTTSTLRGGQVGIIAEHNGKTAIGTVVVRYVGTMITDGVDPSLFAVAEVPASGTGMLYPLDGVVVPKNQPSMHFQWQDLGGVAYRLQFQSEVTELTVYSTSLDWISDTELWPVICESNAGFTIETTLSARVGDQVMVKDPQTMTVQDLEAIGSIIYWTPTAQGLMEIPYGESARSFLTQAETGRCVGCHAVSSQGMVAFTYDGGSAPLGMKTIDGLEDRIPYGGGGNSNYKVFSPDGSLLLAGLNGTLSLFDGVTGAFLSNPTIEGASWVNNMDWAPDDSYLVFVDSPGTGYDLTFSGGRIMRAPHLGGGSFGPAEEIVNVSDLVAPYGFSNVYYPAVSPDSKWVLFNASTGDSYDDPDASLFVVPIEGGTPIELAKANQDYSQANSLPKWAPATSGDDIWWFAFASRRNYGTNTAGNPQIWMSSFDPAEAEAGFDPSSTSIWMSSQNPSQNNHIPLWVP